MVDIRTWRPGFTAGLATLALLVFGLTLGQGVTLNSLPLSAHLAGWYDQPMTDQPWVWLLTGWLRLLPPGQVPLATNAFSAFCAVVVLALLARSVQLLPQNRQLLARQTRPAARRLHWTAPAIAVTAAGLELNFWQEAVAGTGQMLDLLLFATPLWCMLEYTRDRRHVWLSVAIFLWGLGIIENVGMLLLLPCFLVGVFWLRCPDRIDWRFLTRMAVLLLLGSSLFFALPIANSLLPDATWTFLHALRMAFLSLSDGGENYYKFFCTGRPDIGILLAVYFLLPLLPLLILIKQEAGFAFSRPGRYERLIFYGFNAVCFVFCLWVSLDPCFDSWVVVKRDTGVFLPLLALIYLNACAAGYLMQFWLLAATAGPDPAAAGSPPVFKLSWLPAPLRQIPRRVLPLLPLLLASLLLAKNLPLVRQFNAQPLTGLANLAFQSLPPEGGVLLSDDQEWLLIVRAALAGDPGLPPCLPVDILTLNLPEYRQKLAARYPGWSWLNDPGDRDLDNFGVLQLLGHAVVAGNVYQPRPGSGFYFELLDQQPRDALYAVQIRAAGQREAQPLTADQLAAGEQFWDRIWQTRLEPLSRLCSGPPSAMDGFLKRWFYVDKSLPAQTAFLGQHYAADLDNWGVILQRQGRLKAAARRFQQATRLDPDNTAAAVNLENNATLQAGGSFSLTGIDSAAQQFGNIRELSETIVQYGHFDDPVVCYLLGCILQQRGLPQQAIEQFERVTAFVPNVTAPRLALVDLYAATHQDTLVTATIEKLRTLSPPADTGDTNELHLSMLEANSWFAQTNYNRAHSVLRDVLRQHAGDPHIPKLVLQTYLAFGDYTNALQLVQTQLAADTNNVTLMNNESAILIQMNQPARAIPILDRVLTLTNFPLARLDRASAYKDMGNLAAAEADYLKLQGSSVNQTWVLLGLARIADQRHQTNRAVEFYQQVLDVVSESSPQAQQVRERLNVLVPAAN